MGNRPGVMIYFDIRPNLKLLTLEQRGILFDAILEYGELGVEPDLEGILAMAWGFIKPRIDKDGERYSRQIAQRQYATYCREKKRSNEEPLSFDAWMSSKDNDCYRPMTEDDERYPTTSTTTTQPQLQLNNNPNYNKHLQQQKTTATGGVGEECKKTKDQEFEDLRRERIAALVASDSPATNQMLKIM